MSDIEIHPHENYVTKMNNGEISTDPEQCWVDDFGGKGHSYGMCVRPPIGLKADVCDTSETGYNFGWDCMGKNFGEMVSYMNCLLIDDKHCLANSNLNNVHKECAPLSGNTYALKTKSKCKDEQGNEQTLSKFINNQSGCKNLITGRSGADSGAMMKALTKAGCIVDGGLFNSFMGKTKPGCKPVKAKCSISAPEGGEYKLKSTPTIYLENEQADYLIDQKMAILAKPDSFTNLYEDVYNYYKKNPDIVLNNNLNNTNNINHKNNTNVTNEIFNSIILLLLLYILFKILYKK